MVVITGSKSETPKLLSVVSKRYLDLSKYYKNDEIQAIQSWMKKQPHLPTISGKVFKNAVIYLYGPLPLYTPITVYTITTINAKLLGYADVLNIVGVDKQTIIFRVNRLIYQSGSGTVCE